MPLRGFSKNIYHILSRRYIVKHNTSITVTLTDEVISNVNILRFRVFDRILDK